MPTTPHHRSAPQLRAKKEQMPRAHFTDVTIRTLKEGTWFDERLPAFGIRVGKSTKRWFVIRTQKRIRTNVGHYPQLSLADARVAAKQLLSEPEALQPISVTLAEARDRYLVEHTGAPSTVRELTRLLTKHFGKLDGKSLAEITDTDIQRSITGLARSEALHAFRAARAAFRWFTRPPRRYIRHSPLEGYAPPSKDGRRTRILSDQEIGNLLCVATSPATAIIRLALLWGLRKGELLTLRRDWIDGDVLTVPATHTKNRRPLTIPLLPLATSILAAQPERGVYFFPGRLNTHTHLNDGSWGKFHRELLQASETTGWGLHDLRRTFRSACARNGVPRDIAERLLNHTQGALDEIYDHYTYDAEKREALAKVENWIQSLNS